MNHKRQVAPREVKSMGHSTIAGGRVITIKRFLSLCPLTVVCSLSPAFAGPIGQFLNVSGDVQVYSRTEPARRISTGASVEPGTSIVTGPNSSAVLKFQDRQSLAIQSNSLFRIREYRYDPTSEKASVLAFELVKGGLRSVTGAIGENNREKWSLITPSATIMVRGTDFLVAIRQGSVYLQVKSGEVAAINNAGTSALKAGQTGFVANEATLGAIGAAPPGEIFAELQTIALTPGAGGAATSAGAATGGGGVGLGTSILIGAGVAGAAAAFSSGGGTSTTTHH